ncbi:MAG: pyrroline-5-carboxylate reductase [Actinomycetes bacterium]
MSRCVGIVGVGNMGEALLAGLIASGHPASQICITDKREDHASALAQKYGVTLQSASGIAAECEVILVVVKPTDLEATLTSMKATLGPRASIVSFVAGKTIAGIEAIVGGNHAVIRVMPNTPTLIGKGMAAISPGTYANADDLGFVRHFLGSSGRVVEVEESLQDAVTATSGSGPAYFFAFVESMVAGAVKLGLSEAAATELTVQTIIGAAGMLEQSGKDAKTLRENVTSPNGTTAAALASFEASGLPAIVADAMAAAAKRSAELA